MGILYSITIRVCMYTFCPLLYYKASSVVITDKRTLVFNVTLLKYIYIYIYNGVSNNNDFLLLPI